ncbi:Sugar transferase involved in LPS biosynthesis (colanic, teichoic acid) [Cohaesibacter sp. ES.047]|uniref:hybrid nucleoside-diphosphate sugar epimerase/sugar transferase n=1 Tax=Cohaesibacter sp. ES.047 TaxID=1798205 RepID=UPI000BB96D6B|nr:hybrid nucleoside-diphosphate sugar epimerase/sugar transferase [Cohaesibacter sp. ES.047]SNY89886.1 Sugar transferase involved in LPS biosynthesis (colanic, teichoic acid) [Cohaesibacter sp. ES.047]
MKIVITGASGFLGTRLVHFLARIGHQLLLVGRDDARLRALFPDQLSYSYADASPELLCGYEACIHMATRNSDVGGSLLEYQETNVELLRDFCDILLQANVSRHIYVSSILAEENGRSFYAKTKWQAECLIQSIAQSVPNWQLTILRPAFIQTLPYRGKLSLLNRFPTVVSEHAFQIVSAIRPVASLDDVLQTIEHALAGALPVNEGPILLTNRQKGNRFYSLVRLLCDYTFVFAVLCFGWLFPIFFLLVKLDSPGPAIFSQKRVGKDGKLFMCYKFRSMRVGTQDVPTHELPPLTVTKIGQFLRKTKIDELPQIWNILRRDMSLVGPRPCLPTQDKLLLCRKKLGVLNVLPGLTGYAQVNKVDMSDPERLAAIDNEYINRRSLILDLKIVLKTAFG